MYYLDKLKKLTAKRTESALADRIASELIYLNEISKYNENAYQKDLEKAVDFLLDFTRESGVITRDAVTKAEELLAHLAPVAKSYKALFLAHAHIDMNWQWGYNETASLTVDTIQTVLTLMREYPEFTYAQSQASVYEIIEEYAPHLLDEIRARICEGRWEVTAAEWVEPDKNMPNGESLTRQILQAKKYLSELLKIDPNTLCINFVPDTFGHNAQTPEILADAGIRYMYHCRGIEDQSIYRFVSPAGKETLNYCEFDWYLGAVTPEKFEIAPRFCHRNGVRTYLCIYGVGDHGGGPSRRDIERILEYRSWPLTPDISFGTLRQMFEALEEKRDSFPIVRQELNCLFTGCYTTQARIKMSNRISEARMNEAEALSAMNSILTDAPRHQEQLDRAWRNILFNHFHDILPGSGTIETREYALGRFQDTLAKTATHSTASMRSIADRIDTSAIPFEADAETVSEGGGVGFYDSEINGFRIPATERGRGAVRALHLFNPTGYERHETTELTIWDYPYASRLSVEDVQGNPLPFSFTVSKGKGYWGHHFVKLLVSVTLPPFGYTTVIVRPRHENDDFHAHMRQYEKSDEFINDEPLVLENDLVRATFDHTTMEMIEFYDKTTNETLINAPACHLDLIEENPLYNYEAWRVGPYMKETNLNRACGARFTGMKTDVAASRVGYEIRFGASVATVEALLKKDSRTVEFSLTVDWNELPEVKRMIPQLRFTVPVADASAKTALYDIPYGEIERPALAHDVPALSYLGVNGNTSHVLGLVTETKYGFRYNKGIASVTLLRSAYKPDPYSDRGIHHIRLGIVSAARDELKKISDCFNHPICFTSATAHTGTLPLEGSVLRVTGATVSCLKNAEDNTAAVLRLYHTESAPREVTLDSLRPIASLTRTNALEIDESPLPHSKHTASLTVDPFDVVTIKVKFV